MRRPVRENEWLHSRGGLSPVSDRILGRFFGRSYGTHKYPYSSNLQGSADRPVAAPLAGSVAGLSSTLLRQQIALPTPRVRCDRILT